MVGQHKSRLSIVITWTILIIFTIIVIYPFVYALSYSLSDSAKASAQGVVFLPRGFTLENYAKVFQMKEIYTGFVVSVARTVVGVIYSVLITALASYALTKKKLPGRKAISIFLIIPMYISGGLLPTYVLMNKLNLFNTFWVYILPHGFWAFNMLIMRTYFESLPQSLEEAAKIDGAGSLAIFFKIVFPLSMPVIAVVAMYNGVFQWNSWFDAALYITNSSLKPLQLVLQELIQSSIIDFTQPLAGFGNSSQISTITIRMTVIMVTTIPIICVFPMLQKYFTQGMMIGAVKE